MRLYSGSWSLWRELRNWKWDRDMRRHFIVLQSCLAWRKRDSKEGGGSVVMVCVSVWGVRLMGGLSVVDDLTITGNFPTVCTQRGPSKGKKDEKE